MRILIMGNNDKYGGGLMVHYTMLTAYLQKLNFELMCVSINDTGEKLFNNKSVIESVVAYKPKTIIQKIKKYFQLKLAIAKAKRFSPEIFIATGLGYGYAMMAEKLPASTFKFFQEVHFEATANKLRIKMVNCFNTIAVQTRGMIAPFLKNVSPLKPVAALPCFSKEYPGDKIENIPSAQRGVRLAYFGRLAWNKGITQFISAAHEVFDGNKNLLLDIYGKGVEMNAIKEEIEKRKLQAQISLKGFYEDDEFPSLISSYHGIIIPSIGSEGLPLVLIESMRFGRPVFATITGAMPEVASVNSDGMMITNTDASGIKKNLLIFLDRIRQEKYNANTIYAVYRKYFSNEIFMQTWLAMLGDPKKYFTKNLSS